MRGTPVRHDKPGELHDVFEVAHQRGVVLARPGTVYPVVGAHEGADAGFDGASERGVIPAGLRYLNVESGSDGEGAASTSRSACARRHRR